MESILTDLITLTRLSESDYQVLRDHQAQTQLWGNDIVKEFYDTLYAYERTAKIFKEGERQTRETALGQWYIEITSGNYPQDFWQRQWVIGLVHISQQVTNPFMLAMISRMQQTFLKKCLQTYPPAEAEQVFSSFKRVTDVIAGLIAEGYFVNYISAMEQVGGLKLSLVQRMIDLEIKKKLSKIKQK